MKEYEGQKVLVVGGAGFVGANLVNRLLGCNPKEIVVVDNLLSSERENLPVDRRLVFLESSINRDSLLASLPTDFDYVFHLATFHGNQNSIELPLDDHEHNTLSTLKLLERIRAFQVVKKVVYASAGCTVAEKTYEAAAATTEESPVSLFLDSPYQISKIVGEFYCNYYWKQHGIPTIRARFQNVYGPGEVLGAGRWRGTAHTVWRNVVPTFVYQALRQLPLRVENGGAASRDFIFVEDIAAGLMCCGARGTAPGAYNLASGRETTILELAQTINRLCGNPAPLEAAPRRTWDRSGKRFGSTDKARTEIGFEASVELEAGLRRTIDWTRANLRRIESCIVRHQHRMAA